MHLSCKIKSFYNLLQFATDTSFCNNILLNNQYIICFIEYKQILHGVSGQFQTGEFIGILGPSGTAYIDSTKKRSIENFFQFLIYPRENLTV